MFIVALLLIAIYTHVVGDTNLIDWLAAPDPGIGQILVIAYLFLLLIGDLKRAE